MKGAGTEAKWMDGGTKLTGRAAPNRLETRARPTARGQPGRRAGIRPRPSLVTNGSQAAAALARQQAQQRNTRKLNIVPARLIGARPAPARPEECVSSNSDFHCETETATETETKSTNQNPTERHCCARVRPIDTREGRRSQSPVANATRTQMYQSRLAPAAVAPSANRPAPAPRFGDSSKSLVLSSTRGLAPFFKAASSCSIVWRRFLREANVSDFVGVE